MTDMLIRNRGMYNESRKCVLCKNYTRFMFHEDGSKTSWSKLRHIPPTDLTAVCHIHSKNIRECEKDITSASPPSPNLPETIPDNLQCSICIENGCDRITSCGHTFHDKCIKTWFNKQGSLKCPNCRNNVSILFHDCEARNKHIIYKLDKYKKEADSLKIQMEQLKKRHDICASQVSVCENWSRLAI